VMNDEKKMKFYGFAFVILLLPYILLHLNFTIGLYSGGWHDVHVLSNVSMIANIESLLS
jgi:hypothetical protein